MEPASKGGPTTMRRLNEAQYKNSIHAIFSPDIKVPGRFEPPLRDRGLLAIGDGTAVISRSGIEQYELRAREIASQVLSEKGRQGFMSCAPRSTKEFDKNCAAAFLGKYGRLLFRRPLNSVELTSALDVAELATKQTSDAYKGLEAGLARLLGSANFVFRIELSVPDSSMPGGARLDDHSLASRISFLMWNAPPDEELLAAAESGALRKSDGLTKQVERLAASPLFEQGVRAFFSDMFAYDLFDDLSKDQTIYPKYTSALAKDAQEQTLRTIVDHLVTNQGDYRDLFTTRKTFMNRNLASLYRVPLDASAGLDKWMPYTFSEADKRAGILTLAGFLMLDPSHEGRSSPTIRGKMVRELMLCHEVPLPPGNVDFSAVQNTSDPLNKTARDRLTVHQENPICAGCHSLTDPIGLSMENFDALGIFRTHENGAVIDASGQFEGKTYDDVMGLEKVLRDGPGVSSCAVQRAFEYGVGRPLTKSEIAWLNYAGERFAADGYRFPALMRHIANSQAFRAVAKEPASCRTKSPQSNELENRRVDMANWTRRNILRGMMRGSAVAVALPLLDIFLDDNGEALAASGAPIPTRFGTWFWGCGINAARWIPDKVGADYDLKAELVADWAVQEQGHGPVRFQLPSRRQAEPAALVGRHGDVCGRRADQRRNG